MSNATYNSWAAMKRRCFNPKDGRYHRYGARGITVCEAWMSFDAFLRDMGEKPPTKQLDRINNDGNYEPSNCRWATTTEQQNNRSTNRRITFNGITQTVTLWCRDLGVAWKTVFWRLDQGWSVERALTQKERKCRQPTRNQNA